LRNYPILVAIVAKLWRSMIFLSWPRSVLSTYTSELCFEINKAFDVLRVYFGWYDRGLAACFE